MGEILLIVKILTENILICEIFCIRNFWVEDFTLRVYNYMCWWVKKKEAN